MDHAPGISTVELLQLIDKHGAGWPAAAPAWGLNEVGDAIQREIASGNLHDAARLTEQGRRLLIDVRSRQRLPPG